MMTQKMKKDQVKKFFLILQKNNITEKVRSKNSITDQKKKKKRKEKKNEIEHTNSFHPEDDKEKGRKFYEKMQKYT